MKGFENPCIRHNNSNNARLNKTKKDDGWLRAALHNKTTKPNPRSSDGGGGADDAHGR